MDLSDEEVGRPVSVALSELSCDEADVPKPANVALSELSCEEADVPRPANVALSELSCDEADAPRPANAVSAASIEISVEEEIKQLNICYFNARSIVNKSLHLHNFIASSNYDIIFIVETWLNANLHDALVCPQGYNVIRRDRFNQKGGGVLVLHRSQLIITEVRKSEPDHIEYICIDVLGHKPETSPRLFCAYFPPAFTKKDITVSSFCELLFECKSNRSLFYLFGDLNMPFIDWKSSLSSTKPGNTFLDFCFKCGLHQYIEEPTTNKDSLLDLLLCDQTSASRLTSVTVLPPLTSTCDHSIIDVSLCLDNLNTKYQSIPTSYNYRKGNYEQINLMLSNVDWEAVFRDFKNDVQSIYDYFLDLVHSLVRKYIPSNTFKIKPRQPKHLTKLAKKKRSLYKKSKSNPRLKEEYKNLSKEYDRAVSSWYDTIENKVCLSDQGSSFYKYANKKLKSLPVIPPLASKDSGIVTCDTEKADMFNTVFHAVFTTDNGAPLELQSKVSSDTYLEDLVVTEEDILNVLAGLSPKLSRTPDDLPVMLVKRISLSIKGFLSMFYNLSIKSSQIPWQWKISLITPIYKKGPKCNPSNYRPISLTSILCRVLEKIISSHVLNHLLTNNLISSNQHGFLPRRSTVTQLITVLNDWTHSYASKECTTVVYTDLTKAFDKVSHPKLLEVITSYGLKGKVYDWIKCFLIGRVQRVAVGKSFSNILEVRSGVPQGSVLGPLLFLLYIDDVTRLCTPHTSISLFADDTKLYSTSPSHLQSDIDIVYDFLNKRQLDLALNKCETITISKTTESHPIRIGGTYLKETTVVKDLGIHITSTLEWREHITKIKNKALQKCYQILRSFSSKNVWILLRAYLTFVRPLLEYGSPIWSPHLDHDKKLVESVQRYYTKKICQRCSIPFTSYEDRLYKLSLNSLEYRRKEIDLVMVFKIINNLVDLRMEDFFEWYVSPYNTRRHSLCITNATPKSELQKSYFSRRVILPWNSLPEKVATATCINTFKSRLKSVNLDKLVPSLK